VDVLARRTGLGATTVSAHLQAPRNGGLVVTRRQGARTYYRLSGEDVDRLYAALPDVARVHLAEPEWAIVNYLGHDDLERVSREELLGRLSADETSCSTCVPLRNLR
jgi:DNA-binding transcriptional ArsR family regulator